MATKSIIAFDGYCPLCHWCIRFVLKNDLLKRFYFVSLQSIQGQDLMRKLVQKKLSIKNMSSVVYQCDGDVFLGFSAVVFILRDLGRGWRVLGMILGWVPLWIGNFVYSVVARFRYKLFGRYDHCPLPSKDVQDRFL